MLVRLYGELWNPDGVEWGNRGRGNRGQLRGYFSDGKKSKVKDFWDARGVYALYDNFKLVYIGQALEQTIGKRLRDHLTDRLAGRWDMFSWYSISSFRERTVREPGARYVSPGDVIDTLESFAIAITSPPLNRRYGEMPSARRVDQAKSPRPHTIRHYLESILERLDEQAD